MTSPRHAFFTPAIAAHGEPEEVVTDRAAALANVIEELLPQALHNTTKHANNRVECDHGRLTGRLRPMRGLKTDRTATAIIEGHTFIQNLRRGHHELGVDARAGRLRCAAAFDELASMICTSQRRIQSPRDQRLDNATETSRHIAFNKPAFDVSNGLER